MVLHMHTLATCSEEIGDPGKDLTSDTKLIESLDSQSMVDAVERFRKVCHNQGTHSVPLVSTSKKNIKNFN